MRVVSAITFAPKSGIFIEIEKLYFVGIPFLQDEKKKEPNHQLDSTCLSPRSYIFY